MFITVGIFTTVRHCVPPLARKIQPPLCKCYLCMIHFNVRPSTLNPIKHHFAFRFPDECYISIFCISHMCYIHLQSLIYVCICICVCVCMYVYVCVCVYVCIYVCMCLYTYIRTLVGLSNDRNSFCQMKFSKCLLIFSP
jgi:hypothetical protein